MQPFEYLHTIPAFIVKLWKMTEDPKTDDIICWNKNGRCVLIFNELKFRYILLAQYYKHTNMSSFIRQLNMYGFHKISAVINCDSDQNEKPVYQFINPCFQRGQLALLKDIKRKVSTSNTSKLYDNNDSDLVDKLDSELNLLRRRQNEAFARINSFKQENIVLWQEIVNLQQKQQKYEQMLNKLIQFIVTVVQPPTRFEEETGIKKCSLMIQDNPSKNVKATGSPTIHEIVSESTLPGGNAEVDTNILYNVNPETPSNCQTPVPEHESFNLADEFTMEEPSLNQIELPEDFNPFPNGFPDDSNLYLKNLNEVYLNSPLNDPLLTSILSDINIIPKYDSTNNSKKGTPEMEQNRDQNDMPVATRSNSPYTWLLSLGNSLDSTELLNNFD